MKPEFSESVKRDFLTLKKGRENKKLGTYLGTHKNKKENGNLSQ